MHNFKRVFLFMAVLASMIGCQKDLLNHAENELNSANQSKIPITVSEAQDWFQTYYHPSASADSKPLLVKMAPQWHDATIGYAPNGQPIAMVPLPDSALRYSTAGRAGAKLLFSKTDIGEIDVSMIVYFADSAYWAVQNAVLNFNNFTGTFSFLDLDQNFKTGVLVINGSPVGPVKDVQITAFGQHAEEREDQYDEGDCIDHVQSEFVEVDCPEQAFTECYNLITVTSTDCSGGGNGSGGGSGGSGGGSSGGSGNNNGGNPGQGGWGGGGGSAGPIDTGITQFDNPGGWYPNGNSPEEEYWQVFLGKIPVEIFLANGGELPEGFDTQLAQQFAAIHQYHQFSPEQLNFLESHPWNIPLIYNATFNPVGEEGLWVKSILDFVIKNSLSYSQFQYLLTNYEKFPVFADFMTSQGQTSATVIFLKDILDVVIKYNLSFVTTDDLNFLFAHPTYYTQYKSYLEQNPNATQTEKIASLRMHFGVDGPEHPLYDLPQRLNCFNTTTNQNVGEYHGVGLYVDQPVANNTKPYDDRSGPVQKLQAGGGHTWLCLIQQIGGQTTILSLGLYPVSSASPLTPHDPGAFSHDENRAFDVSVTWSLAPEQFNLLVDHLRSYSTPPDYDLNDNNCTTFAVGELSNIGIFVPQTICDWTFGEGLCPGQLGQDLRNMQLPNGAGRNVDGGISPQSTCE